MKIAFVFRFLFSFFYFRFFVFVKNEIIVSVVFIYCLDFLDKMATDITETIRHLLPDDFDVFYSEDEQNLMVHYLHQLSPIEKKACNIAKKHLETSYDVLKSNGFVNWNKERIKIMEQMDMGGK